MSYSFEELFWFIKAVSGYVLSGYLKKDDPSITELEIPKEYNGEPVVRIMTGAFMGAEHLKSVKIPKTVKMIHPAAFLSCPELERVELGGKPKIKLNAFSMCPKLPPETVAMGLVCSIDITRPISKGYLRAITGSTPDEPCDCFRPDVFELLVKNDCFRECSLKRVFCRMILNNKAELLHFAESHGMLEDAELVDALINYSAKHQSAECTAYLLDLKSRKFGFENKDELEFSEIEELFRFVINANKSLGGYALAEYLRKNDPSITELEIPSKYKGKPVTMICSHTFSGTRYLKRVVIPPSVRYIAGRAFTKSEALESVKLSDGPITLGSYAFHWCENLERVEFGDPPPELGREVFGMCGKLPPELLAMSVTRSTDISKPIHRTDFRETVALLPASDSFRPDVFELLAKNNCFRHRNVLFMFKEMIEQNTWEHFKIAERYGMLFHQRLVDMLISCAVELGNTEMTAYLLDLKKRKFGFNGDDDLELK